MRRGRKSTLGGRRCEEMKGGGEKGTITRRRRELEGIRRAEGRRG